MLPRTRIVTPSNVALPAATVEHSVAGLILHDTTTELMLRLLQHTGVTSKDVLAVKRLTTVHFRERIN